MGSKNVVKLKDEDTGIDPRLFFQRMVILFQRDEIEVNDLIDYEICPYPPNLFDSSSFLRKAEKSQLTKAIVIYVKKQCELPASEENVDCYVLDGGSLLHRLSWNKNSTYDAISDHYVDFVNKNYPNAIAIVDGYESGPSTKHMTHHRRSGQVMSPAINFTGNMALSFSKDKFLSNDTNKQNIINLIGKILQIAGCSIFSGRCRCRYSPGSNKRVTLPECHSCR